MKNLFTLDLFQFYSNQRLDDILFGSNNLKVQSYSVLLFNILFATIQIHLNNTSFFFIFLFLISYTGFIHSKSSLGLIPNLRFFLLVSPAFLQCIFWYFSNDSIRVALLANSYINDDIIRFSATISLVAASSSMIGFTLKPFNINIKSYNLTKIYNLNYIYLILFFLFTFLYTSSVGYSLIEVNSYGTQSKNTNINIGTLNVFMFFFLCLYYITINIKLSKFTPRKIISFFVILSLFNLALRGIRQDPFGLLITLFLLNYLYEYKKFNNINKHFLVMKLLILFWIFSVFTGAVRNDFSLNVFTILISFFNLFFKFNDGYLIFNLDTASMVIGTLNVIPYKLSETGYLLGQSYLDWLPRTLPSILHSNRPLSLAYEMKYNSTWFGWGGIHEVAESYYNFGLLGVVILPFFISYLLKSLGKSFIKSYSLYTAIPVVWLIMMPRYIWYQTFALYKSTLTIILLIYIISFTIKTVKYGTYKR